MAKKEEWLPKIDERVLVRPKARGTRPVPNIPWPADARPIRYLPKDQFTRVRFDDYLQNIYRAGNLEVLHISEWSKLIAQEQAENDPPAGDNKPGKKDPQPDTKKKSNVFDLKDPKGGD